MRANAFGVIATGQALSPGAASGMPGRKPLGCAPRLMVKGLFGPMTSDRITRHKLIDRLFHWGMAATMIALMGTALCPILGLEFDWVPIHWIAGVILAVLIVWHTVRAIFQQDLMSMWVGPVELIKAVGALKRGDLPKTGKYSIAQRLMHKAVSAFGLAALVTGLLMLVRIDTPFWERDPYLLAQSTWGFIYVIHGLSAVIFFGLIMMHVYFALRPEKLFYTRSMILGWITRGEFNANHDAGMWKHTATKKQESDA